MPCLLARAKPAGRALITRQALLSVAKTVADSFLNYAAPRKAEYRLFTHAYTPDLSPDSR